MGAMRYFQSLKETLGLGVTVWDIYHLDQEFTVSTSMLWNQFWIY